MNLFFMPGVLLMNALRYPVKFGLIFTIVLIPMVGLSVLLVDRLNEQIEFLEKERIGLSYIKVVRQPIEYIQQHRGMTAAYLNGAKEFASRIESKRYDVDSAMQQLIRIDTDLGATLQTAGLVQRIEAQWLAIKASAMHQKTSEAIQAHSELIADLLDLMTHVADSSQITLDPNLDSYYLGRVLVTDLPGMIENMGQARAVGSAVAAAANFTSDSFIRLSILSNNIDALFNSSVKALNSAFGANAELAQDQRNDLKQSQVAVRNMQHLLRDQLLTAESITVESQTVFNKSTQAISGAYVLYDQLVPALDAIFVNDLKQARLTLRLSVISVVCVMLLTVYLFVSLYRSALQSIKLISSASERLASGDLTVRAELETKDEMKEIASRFNAMGENFSSLINGVINTANQLASSSQQVSAVAHESGQIVNNQRHETDQVATAIDEMAATAREVANNAAGASDAANNADDRARNGMRVVETATAEISSLAEEIEKAASVIVGVEEDSSNISAVLDVIKNIAEQTNLLALNAAIEAARAGEQGRGFAVVADEVRTLASRTHDSTQEIEEMISKLQIGAKEAVAAMEKSQVQAQKGVEQALHTTVALKDITESISTINLLNTQIASAAEQQTAATEEVQGNVISINDLSQHASTGSTQTSASAGELAQLASELQKVVMQFKVA